MDVRIATILLAALALTIVVAEPAAAGPGGVCSYDDPWLDDMCDGLFPYYVAECAARPDLC